MRYADENVWMPVVEGLRRRGRDVTTAMEEGTLDDADADQLDYAASNGWSLLTFADDFLSMVESGAFERDHAGIVYVSQHGRDVGELVRRIDAALERNADRDLTNEVVFAEERPVAGSRRGDDRELDGWTTANTGPLTTPCTRRTPAPPLIPIAPPPTHHT